MLSVEQTKPILAMAGINNLSVRFEPEARCIRVEFDRGSERRTEYITFEQIESIFTASARPPAAARASESVPTE